MNKSVTKEQANRVLKDMLVNIGEDGKFKPLFDKDNIPASFDRDAIQTSSEKGAYYFHSEQYFPLIGQIRVKGVNQQDVCQDLLCYLLPLQFGVNRFNKNSTTAKLQVLEVIVKGELDNFGDLKGYLGLHALVEFDKIFDEYFKSTPIEKRLVNITSGIYRGYSIQFLRDTINDNSKDYHNNICKVLYGRIKRYNVIELEDLKHVMNSAVSYIEGLDITKETKLKTKEELLTVVADEMFRSKYYEIIRQSKSNPEKFVDFDDAGIFERTSFINKFVSMYINLV